MLYRICTEDVNREKIAALTAARFTAFTLVPAFGYWDGKQENSLVVEIAGRDDIGPEVNALAFEIKTANSQEAVLVQRLSENSILI